LRTVEWTDPAIADLLRLSDWYGENAPGFFDKAADRITAALEPLRARPSLGTPMQIASVRKWSVRGTPFLLLYRPVGTDRLEILAVRHNRQNWRQE